MCHALLCTQLLLRLGRGACSISLALAPIAEPDANASAAAAAPEVAQLPPPPPSLLVTPPLAQLTLELVHRAPLLAEETTPVLLLLRMHGDACVDGEICVSVAPKPAAEAAAAAAAATTAAAAALASPTAATTAAAALAAPPADVPTAESGTLLSDEHGVPIAAPLPLPLLAAHVTHAVALRLSTAAAGTLHLVATVRYRPLTALTLTRALTLTLNPKP